MDKLGVRTGKLTTTFSFSSYPSCSWTHILQLSHHCIFISWINEVKRTVHLQVLGFSMYTVNHEQHILFPAASHPPLFLLFPAETHVWRWTDGERGNRFVFFLHCGNKLCLFSNWILIWKDSLLFLYTRLNPIKALRSLLRAKQRGLSFSTGVTETAGGWNKVWRISCVKQQQQQQQTENKMIIIPQIYLEQILPVTLCCQCAPVVFLLFSCSFSFFNAA